MLQVGGGFEGLTRHLESVAVHECLKIYYEMRNKSEGGENQQVMTFKDAVLSFMKKQKGVPDSIILKYENTPEDELNQLFFKAMENIEDKREEARKRMEERKRMRQSNAGRPG